MPYGIIVTVAAIALTGVYVFTAETSYGFRALVAGLLLASFTWRYGFYLRVALGVVLALYFTKQRARWEKD